MSAMVPEWDDFEDWDDSEYDDAGANLASEGEGYDG